LARAGGSENVRAAISRLTELKVQGLPSAHGTADSIDIDQPVVVQPSRIHCLAGNVNAIFSNSGGPAALQAMILEISNTKQRFIFTINDSANQ
jgi:hypothetical protein